MRCSLDFWTACFFVSGYFSWWISSFLGTIIRHWYRRTHLQIPFLLIQLTIHPRYPNLLHPYLNQTIHLACLIQTTLNQDPHRFQTLNLRSLVHLLHLLALNPNHLSNLRLLQDLRLLPSLLLVLLPRLIPRFPLPLQQYLNPQTNPDWSKGHQSCPPLDSIDPFIFR